MPNSWLFYVDHVYIDDENIKENRNTVLKVITVGLESMVININKMGFCHYTTH